MATMIPDLSEARLNELESQGEAKVYRSLRDNLPERYLVLFDVKWIIRANRTYDGQTDFLICDPQNGCLIIEVKGGGIKYNPNNDTFYTINQQGEIKRLDKHPMTQAQRAKYSILDKLNEHPQWGNMQGANVFFGHAVFFPDIVIHQLPNYIPDLPHDCIGTNANLENPEQWINNVFEYYINNFNQFTLLDPPKISLIREIFATQYEIPISINTLITQNAEHTRTLTEQQMKVLDVLKNQRRAAVSGGAGTGKTVLACEKARRLANEGFRTLLTCYNDGLANYLKNLCINVENIDVMNFHSLCRHQIRRAQQMSSRDLLAEAQREYPYNNMNDEDKKQWLHNTQLPNALLNSLEILRDRYDAIVCDEGQDFREEYWIPLTDMLNDHDNSPFYIFYDDNQNIFDTRTGTFPVETLPFPLTVNCRNTIQIHQAAYQYYDGETVTPPTNHGTDVEFISAANLTTQSESIRNRIVMLIIEHGVSGGDIVILIVDSQNKRQYYNRLQQKTLPRTAQWLVENRAIRQDDEILIDTVKRFKGLESPVVILWGIDGEYNDESMYYVGMSRAMSQLLIVGTNETCSNIRDNLAI